MLRSAMDLGGFHQVIFICHTPQVRELADRILSVGNGRAVLGDSEGDVVNAFPIVSTPLEPAKMLIPRALVCELRRMLVLHDRFQCGGCPQNSGHGFRVQERALGYKDLFSRAF